MWLDADFAGGRGRTSRGKTLPTAIREAKKMLEAVHEGQVGIFTEYAIGDCLGYVIKDQVNGPWFEPAETDNQAVEA